MKRRRSGKKRCKYLLDVANVGLFRSGGRINGRRRFVTAMYANIGIGDCRG